MRYRPEERTAKRRARTRSQNKHTAGFRISLQNTRGRRAFYSMPTNIKALMLLTQNRRKRIEASLILFANRPKTAAHRFCGLRNPGRQAPACNQSKRLLGGNCFGNREIERLIRGSIRVDSDYNAFPIVILCPVGRNNRRGNSRRKQQRAKASHRRWCRRRSCHDAIQAR